MQSIIKLLSCKVQNNIWSGMRRCCDCNCWFQCSGVVRIDLARLARVLLWANVQTPCSQFTVCSQATRTHPKSLVNLQTTDLINVSVTGAEPANRRQLELASRMKSHLLPHASDQGVLATLRCCK